MSGDNVIKFGKAAKALKRTQKQKTVPDLDKKKRIKKPKQSLPKNYKPN